jgi:hypothetical protein
MIIPSQWTQPIGYATLDSGYVAGSHNAAQAGLRTFLAVQDQAQIWTLNTPEAINAYVATTVATVEAFAAVLDPWTVAIEYTNEFAGADLPSRKAIMDQLWPAISLAAPNHCLVAGGWQWAGISSDEEISSAAMFEVWSPGRTILQAHSYATGNDWAELKAAAQRLGLPVVVGELGPPQGTPAPTGLHDFFRTELAVARANDLPVAL